MADTGTRILERRCQLCSDTHYLGVVSVLIFGVAWNAYNSEYPSNISSAIGKRICLRFEYAKTQAVETKPIPHKLGNLSIEIRKKLTDVVEMLDSEAIQIIVENIRPDYPNEAMQISELSKDFRFDKILELLKPI